MLRSHTALLRDLIARLQSIELVSHTLDHRLSGWLKGSVLHWSLSWDRGDTRWLRDR